MNASPNAPSIPRLMLAWLLGGWILLSASMSVVATKNFALLKPDALPKANVVFAAIPEGEARTQALRYTASELNRLLFDVYAKAQLAIAGLAVLFAFAAGAGKKTKVMLVLAALIAAAILFYFVPDITARGRVIDFMARDPKPPEVADFQMRHGIEMGVELLKLVLVFFASIGVVRSAK